MPAQDIEYIEHYTNDGQAAVDHLASSLACTRVAESAASGSHSVLLRPGGMQLIVTVSAVRTFRDRGVEFLRTPIACYDMLGERLPGICTRPWSARGRPQDER